MNTQIKKLLIAAALLAISPITYAESNNSAANTANSHVENSGSGENKSKENSQKEKAEKGAPLPLLTLDGVGGVLLTPIAYLVNPGSEGTEIGLPSFGATYVNARQKNVESIGIVETLFQRVELGYNASRFGTGSLQTDVLKYAGVDIERNDVWLHTFNARVNVIRENDFDTSYVPAITLGIHGKYNDGISEINRNLGGLLKQIGYSRDYGVEFTATASKTFLIYGHPLILSATGRATDASNLGYLGYSGRYDFSAEGNAVLGLTDWLFLAFEYRQKINQYDAVSAGGHELIGKENDWWTIGVAAVLSPHTTITAGYGHLGTLLNTTENTAWAAAIKYEF